MIRKSVQKGDFWLEDENEKVMGPNYCANKGFFSHEQSLRFGICASDKSELYIEFVVSGEQAAGASELK